MGILTNTVSKECRRIEYMISEYRKVKDSLPKGTVSPKKIGNQTYYYLKLKLYTHSTPTLHPNNA